MKTSDDDEYFRLLFLEGLLESDLARADFWARHLKESGYTDRWGFFKKLGETWKYFANRFYSITKGQNAYYTEHNAHLFVKRKTWGYIGESELIAANDSLVELGQLWNSDNKRGAEITNIKKQGDKINRHNRIREYLNKNPSPNTGPYSLENFLIKELNLSVSDKTVQNDLKEIK